jgi:tetratricopeptide (TPR) repeat protein
MNDLFSVLGQVAGIGGLSIGLILVITRDIIKKKGKISTKIFRLIRLSIIFSFIIALLGILSWVYVKTFPKPGITGSSEVKEEEINIKFLHEKALGFMQRGDYQSAKKLLLEILKAKPDYIPARNNLGKIYQELNDYKSALREYLEALKHATKTRHKAVLYVNIGNLYMTLNKLDLAEENLKKCLEIMPDTFEAHTNLGETYRRSGKFLLAIRHFDDAIKIGTMNPKGLAVVYHNYAIILKQLGKDIDKAEDYERTAISLDPNLCQAINGLGEIFKLKKDFDAAEKYYNQTIQKCPDFAGGYYNLISVSVLKKDCVKAIELLQKFKLILINQQLPGFSGSYLEYGLIDQDWSHCIKNSEKFKKIIEDTLIRVNNNE